MRPKNKDMESTADKLVRYGIVGLPFAILASAIGLGIAVRYGTSIEVTGTVTYFYQGQSEDVPLYVVIDLDKGGTVRASAPENFVFRKSHKAVIRELTTYIGSKHYSFRRYLN